MSKIDPCIKAYLKGNTRRKIPVIITCRGDTQKIKGKVTYNGGKLRHEYENVNALACDLSSLGVDRLSEQPDVCYITMDYKASLCMKAAASSIGISHAASFHLTGKGVGIGLVDTGVFPHPDLISPRNSISFFQDLIGSFKKPYDNNGHGTFMAGCICSSSPVYPGIAPAADLCIVKAFDASGHGLMSDIMKAIDILLGIREKYNIRVMCLPFEFPYMTRMKSNPLEELIKKAISMDISVVAPSGNMGMQPCSIYFPGNIKDIITVAGAVCESSNKTLFSISSFSGRGPGPKELSKPDLAAPSVNITSLNSSLSYLPSRSPSLDASSKYTTMSGTSIACAIVSAACAVVLEKSPELKCQDLKSVLRLSTISMGENKYAQGTGLFVFDKLLK
jgi:subtilisin family serine protease